MRNIFDGKFRKTLLWLVSGQYGVCGLSVTGLCVERALLSGTGCIMGNRSALLSLCNGIVL